MVAAQIIAVAVVGKHDVPLFVSTYGGLTEDEELWLQCTLVSCLDAVEEKVRAVISALPIESRAAVSPEKYACDFTRCHSSFYDLPLCHGCIFPPPLYFPMCVR